MKNKNFLLKTLLTALAIFGLIVTGCTVTSAGIVFDESVPLEQSSWLNTGQVGEITGYNEIKVTWSERQTIQIPAGDTLLEIHVYARIGTSNTLLNVRGALFRYNFQPEKFYCFLLLRKNGQLGLSVYAWNFGELMGTFDDNHYIEFVPFLNLGSSREPTVLN